MRLDGAEGQIGNNAYSDDQQFLESLQEGAWLTAARFSVPAVCMDGRPTDDVPFLNAPRIAGGTIGLWVGAILAGKAVTPVDFFSQLRVDNAPVGGHRGPLHGHDDGSASGCGAADHLADILDLLVRKPEVVGQLIAEWGFDASFLNQEMLGYAKQLISNAKVDTDLSGGSLVGDLAKTSGASVVDLVGPHLESAALVNLRHHTTVDMAALQASGQPSPQVFHIDAWAIEDTAGVLETMLNSNSANVDSVAVQRLATGIAAFSAAALLVLANPEMTAVISN